MTVVVEFTIPADAFAFGRAFETGREVTVELERVIPTGSAILPFFWVRGDDLDAIEAALREEPVLTHVVRVTTVGDRALFQAEWDDGDQGLIRGMNESDATLLSGVGSPAGWEFHLRFVDQADVTAFRDYCDAHGLPVEYTRIYSPDRVATGTDSPVTPAQRAALVAAYERGYFEEPRETTLADVAADLGVTPQAVSGRLRRGTANLVAETLLGSDGEP